MPNITLKQGDCLELMKGLPDESVNLILTDPPYGISYHSNYGSESYKNRIQNVDWDDNFDFTPYWNVMWNKLKDNSDAYVFGRWENYNTMSKLEGFKQILIWDKQCGGLGDLTTFIPTYELIFYFKKGKRIPTPRTPAVLRSHSQTSWKYGNPIITYLHPTQKPLGIIEKILKISSNTNDTILDPFMGSGTTGVAAIQLNRNFIGFEISPEYFKIAEKRIGEAQAQKKLGEL